MKKHYAFWVTAFAFLSSFQNIQAQTYLHNSTPETTCAGTYYDLGGAAGNYQNLSGATVYKTFTSANGNRMKFTFQQFVLENGVDFLTVYDGPTNAFPVIGRYTGTLSAFSVQSSNTTLTFGFYSNFQNTYAGWAANIECTTAPLPVYVMSTGTTNTCSGMFYDAGGADADYPNFDNRTQTFCSNNGQHIVATFNPNVTNFGVNDTLWAFDGNAVTSPLLGIYTQGSTIETLTSSGTCITFKFKSDGTVNELGWAAELTCSPNAAATSTYIQSSGVRGICDGIFTDDGGESGNYANLSGGTKTQTFQSYNGNRLKFNFQQLVVENGVDFLHVYDGPDASYPVIGSYTGNLAPFSIEGSSKSLTFRFYSNFQNTYAGWRGTFECTTPVLPVYNMNTGTTNTCSGIFYDAGGANTDYPNFDTRTQSFCSNNGQRMVATFNPLATSFGVNDTLWAFDGTSVSSPLLGIYTQGSTIETLTASATCLTFKFKSDGTVNELGWAAMLSCTSPAAGTITYIQSTGVRGTCDGIFTDDGGESGNYSNLSGGTKTQTFQSYNGNRLKINFQQLTLENGVDFLHVYDGPDASYPVIGSYTGNLAPFSIESSGKSLTFRFYSNFQNTAAGWRGTFECTTPILPVYNMSSGTTNTCSGMFYDAGGAFTDYPNFDTRTQSFCSDNGQRMGATFNPLATSFGVNDTLWVFDGSSVSSPMLGIYTQGSIIETLTASGTCLTFKFKSDGTVNELGWAAMLSCTSAAANPTTFVISSGVRGVCSGLFTDDGGASGNYTNLSGVNKVQTFTSYNGNRLVFNFQQFITENGVDALYVYDGPTTSSPLIGFYTGNLAPFAVTSSGSSLTFMFYSNFQNTYAGWLANISCSGPVLPIFNMSSGSVSTCEGMFYDAGGSKANYPQFENRTQTFCSDNGQKIQFHFNKLALDIQLGDSLWAFDGNTTSSQLIGIYVYNSKIEPITSTGTCLTFRFKSAATGARQGWQAAISCVTNSSPLVYEMSSGVRGVCSGVFTDNGGLSGNYDNLNGSRIQTFVSSNNERLKFDFTQFVLENGIDYLQVYDGPNTSYPQIGFYTGNQAPFSVTSTGKVLTFQFYSNFQNVYTGWQANISCAGSALTSYNMSNGTVNACSGVFYDAAGGGAYYPANENRTQTFCSDNGEKVQFNFSAANLTTGDTLFVFDGNSTSAPMIRTFVAASIFESVTSTGTCITFRFKSNATAEWEGWQAIFNCTTTTPSPTTFVMSSGIRGVCTGLFTDAGGLTGNYGNSESKIQTFQSLNGERLRFNFQSFSTEANNDWLSIYDGPNANSPLIGYYSSSTSPGVITSTSNSLTFVFVSSSSSVSSGWVAGIECFGTALTEFVMANGTQNTCNGVFYDAGGKSASYPVNLTQTETFCSDNGQRMQVAFNPLSIGFGTGDTLWIFDGNSISSPLKGFYLASSILEPITASGTCLTFRFKSDATSNSIGWQAMLSCTTSSADPQVYTMSSGLRLLCDGAFADPGGASGQYSNNSNYTQTFQSANGERIKFDFTSFNTESNFDFLDVYDGPTTSYPYLGRYTGSLSNFNITSSSTSLTFYFHSSSSTVASGWLANISCAGPVLQVVTMSNQPINLCEGMWYDDGGITQDYNNLRDYTQTFCSPTGQRLVFNFNPYSFAIAATDTLWVFDGNSTAASSIKALILNGGYVEPIVSSGSCLTFRFKSDAAINSVGWQAYFTCSDNPPSPDVYTMSNAGARYGCSGIFTDMGGLTASYSNGANQIMTFGSSTPGAKVQFNFSQFATQSGFDFLRIYDGPSINSTQIGSYSGSTGPGVVTSTGNTLTFWFTANNSTVSSGWLATMACVSNVPLVGTLQNGPYCAGGSLSVPFTSPNQVDGNVFTAQLSDANGLFSSPTTIGTLSGTTSGTINAILPTGLITSGNYRIRILGSSPANSGNPSAPFSILSLPSQPGTISGNSTLCAGVQNVVYTIPSISGASGYNWTVPSGASIVSGNGTTSITVNFGNASGTISVAATNNCGNGTVRNLAVTVNPSAAPTASVSSNATGNQVCEGSNVNFISNVSAGNNPQYQWIVNGSDFPGATNSTFSLSNVVNSTSVAVRVTTVSGCFNPTNITSSTLNLTVLPSLPASVSIAGNAPNNTICNGQSVTFSSTPTNGGSSPGYSWRVNGNTVSGGSGSSFTSTTLQNGDQISLIFSSSATCATPSSATSNVVSMVVNPVLVPTVSISSPQTQICAGQSATLSANVSNQGQNPQFQWFKNTILIPDATASIYNTPTDLTGSNNFTVKLTSDAVCANPGQVTSAQFGLTVTNSVTPSVGVTSSASGIVCIGQTITFTANPTNGGATPGYQWRVNGNPIAGQTLSTFTTNTLANNDQITVQLTSSDGCANPLTATSTPTVVSISGQVVPSVSATSSVVGNTICAGQSITFTANPTNGGSNPGYVWRINGNAVPGQTGSTFTTSTLANGNTVSVTLTSSFSCASPTIANSTPIGVTVNPSVLPTVNVSSSQGNSICAGTGTLLSANILNGGSTPGYQWFLGGNAISGANGSTYQTPTNLSGSVTYSVQLTSNANCAVPSSVTSQNFVLTINASVTPSISFVSNVSGNTICNGQSITFTSSPENQGSNPGYQWRVNNADVTGQTGSTFTTNTLVDNDLVSVRLTSNALCASPASVTAPNQTITVTPNSPTTVSVSSNFPGNTICNGQNITFTANPVNGGTNPAYQWKVNTLDVTGQTASTFSSFSLNNNDLVSVQITSNSTCASPNIGTSTPVQVTVNPTITPSVALSSNPTGVAFCPGTPIQFTANPVNPGSSPTYEWRVNNNLIAGQNGPTYTLNLAVPSTITATLISNANCANPTSVISSGVILGINPPPTVTAQSDTAVCEATGAFSLSAQPVGGIWSGIGISPTGLFTPGAVGSYKVFYALNSGNCSGLDSVTVQVKARPTIVFPTINPVCATASPVQLSATPTGGTWLGNGVNTSGLFNPATTGPGQQVVSYFVTNNGCSASKPLVVNVTAPPTVDIGGSETVCFSTQEVQMVAVPSGGTWSGEGVDNDGTFTPGFVTPGSTVTLTYTFTQNGCTVLKTKQVTVSFNPAAVNAGQDQTVCLADGPFVLTGFVGSGGTWSGSGVSANGVFNPANSGTGSFTLTYTVTFAQSPTCQGTDSKIVTVIPSPAAPSTLGDTICRQGAGTLTANGIAAFFRWYTNATGGTPISGQVSPLYSTPVLSTSTTYYVSQLTGGCESPRTPVTAFVNSFDNASFSVTLNLLTASPSNGQSYQWLFAGNPIAGGNQSTYTATQNGNYSVIIQLDGCSDTSAVQFVLVTDVDKPLAENKWKVFPNPAQHQLFVEGEGLQEILMLNVLGQEVIHVSKVHEFQSILQIGHIPAGVYWVEMRGLEKVRKAKVVVR